MSNTAYNWTLRDKASLLRLKELWAELDVREGKRTALIRIASLKGLTSFLQYVAFDDDLALRLRPLEPSKPNTTPAHWWYTLVEVERFVFITEIHVPPKDLRAIIAVIEARQESSGG